ncbi:MAG: menaquinone reductase multiheme cytochrome c subunit QrcA, partial [Desulfobacterales bacterium]
MSTADDLDRTESENTADEVAETATSRSGDIKQDGSSASIILFFIIGFVASLAVGWVVFPQLLYSQKEQPVAFNHALHNELVDAGCESCHFFREDGSYSGVPKIAQCIDCHEEVQGDSEAEEYFVTEFVQKGREVPWLIYSRQPPCVFFSHAAHVKKAGMDCV